MRQLTKNYLRIMYRSTSAYYPTTKTNTNTYIISGGVFKGQGGFFTRDISGEVNFLDLAGQLFSRASTISE